ncbi:MAG: 1-acyl-sn-glycerol-3-phosphate acyltransferase [Deltaproteobacteria bacterium]|nr:1-acyl-sn-glycerol-3-phosphate acyltransferase [Deltaproteobacteria bacterium]
MRPQDRERIQVEVVTRVVDRYVAEARRAPDGHLETLINDTLYHERRRLERENRKKKSTQAQLAFYQGIQRRLRHASPRDLRALLDELATAFVAEVVGNFNERVYQLSTRLIPSGLSVLLTAASPGRLLDPETYRGDVSDHVQLQGEVEHARGLLDRGTLIVVPTHLSNLDSVIMGYAAYLVGLPPLLYGAGLNLFTNPVISYFMRNLGAYRVDRKKSATLYKDVLKEYATCSLEMGYHNLFFPGGTRSRSGGVELKLKKGLLGTSAAAFVNNLRAGRPKPNLYVVPCTLSYKLVLEAETLIGDYLTEVGKSRYIIEDDEFSKPRRILNFLSNVVSLDAKIVVRFSEPLDIFGNRVDREGRSLDPHGRPVDPTSYVLSGGEPIHDEKRDAEYTNEVADEVVRAFLRDNVVMSTHLVAQALFGMLRRGNPELDLYRILATGGQTPSFSMHELYLETDRLIATLKTLPGGPRLAEELLTGDAQDVVGDALKHFAIYHTHAAAVRRGDRVFPEDRNLLLYYGNRLNGYDLGRRRSA